uniref:RRP15-like protein n=1 Tax=Myxine glutinosa TaxID=7769 RepID=UPI00358FB8E3
MISKVQAELKVESSSDDLDDNSEFETGGEGEALENDGQISPSEDNPNAGWADAMARVLGKKTPESKPVILSKNKEHQKTKDVNKSEIQRWKVQLQNKEVKEQLCRVKPDTVGDREKERNLQKIATRGVVQLFNSVRKHQKVIEGQMREAGPSKQKRAKLLASVSRKDFIGVLRGSAPGGTAPKPSPKEIKTEETAQCKQPAWSILRDDFMMGAKMKDWDKQSDAEDDESASGVESDSD